jgi:hypothetical protein
MGGDDVARGSVHVLLVLLSTRFGVSRFHDPDVPTFSRITAVSIPRYS